SHPQSISLQLDCNALSCQSGLKLLSLLYPQFDSLRIDSGLLEGALTAVFPADHRPFLEGELLIDDLAFNYSARKLKGEIKKSRLQLFKNSTSNQDQTPITIGKYEILEPAKLVGFF